MRISSSIEGLLTLAPRVYGILIPRGSTKSRYRLAWRRNLAVLVDGSSDPNRHREAVRFYMTQWVGIAGFGMLLAIVVLLVVPAAVIGSPKDHPTVRTAADIAIGLIVVWGAACFCMALLISLIGASRRRGTLNSARSE